MRQHKYVIYELSAKAVISYAVQRDGKYVFELDHSSTMKCKNPGATHEQSSNALFHQILCELFQPLGLPIQRLDVFPGFGVFHLLHF